jgi:hypothetical protein
MPDLNPELLFKCRLIVGRYGEMDIARWWNTSGIMSGLGAKVASRGLPRTEFYGRARALFAVASHRTQEFFSPPGSCTLWSMPPSVENALDEAMIRWAHEGRNWPEVEGAVAELKPGTLGQGLRKADLLSEETAGLIERLKNGPEGKSIRLPDASLITDDTVTLLAAAFTRSSGDSLRLPVVVVKGGVS